MSIAADLTLNMQKLEQKSPGNSLTQYIILLRHHVCSTGGGRTWKAKAGCKGGLPAHEVLRQVILGLLLHGHHSKLARLLRQSHLLASMRPQAAA